MFQIPRGVCSSVWHSTAMSSFSPWGWASLAEVSPPVLPKGPPVGVPGITKVNERAPKAGTSDE
jgi:hypothetical protein